MTIGILATGDEIICGDTLNTNGYEIAHTLHSEGIDVSNHLACSDKDQDILDSIRFLANHCDIIITIGGLGPTSDDRTRFALANFLNEELIEFPEAISHIEQRLNRANLTMNAGNRQQAMFPKNARLFPNPYGTAMGCVCSQGEKLFFLLPGPPKECLPMFLHHALPQLQKTHH